MEKYLWYQRGAYPPFYPDSRLAPGMAAEWWEGRSQGAGGSSGRKLPEALQPHMPDLGGSGLCSHPTRAGGPAVAPQAPIAARPLGQA